ncbi:TPA: hypothetical protein ACKP1B_002312 [Serratia fonticola]
MFNLFFQSAPPRLALTFDLACIVIFESVWDNWVIPARTEVWLWAGDGNQAVLQKRMTVVPEFNATKCLPQAAGFVAVGDWLDEWILMYNPPANTLRPTCQATLLAVFLTQLALVPNNVWQRAKGSSNFPATSLPTTIVHILLLFPIPISLPLTQVSGRIISQQVGGVVLIILTLFSVVALSSVVWSKQCFIIYSSAGLQLYRIILLSQLVQQAEADEVLCDNNRALERYRRHSELLNCELYLGKFLFVALLKAIVGYVPPAPHKVNNNDRRSSHSKKSLPTTVVLTLGNPCSDPVQPKSLWLASIATSKPKPLVDSDPT